MDIYKSKNVNDTDMIPLKDSNPTYDLKSENSDNISFLSPKKEGDITACHSSSAININQNHKSSLDDGLVNANDPSSRQNSSIADNHTNKSAAIFIHDIENGGDSDSLIHSDIGDDAPEDIPKVVVNPGRLLAMVFSCAKWSKSRFQNTILGCLGSIAVLIIRLQLDPEPLAYFIHSIVVFFDMVLIHLFTHSVWLSILGELVTVAMFLAFHFTKETVWELMETTLLAMLCSFHMISSRHKHMTRVEELQKDLKTLCRSTSALLQHSSSHHGSLTRQQSIHQLERMRSQVFHWDSERTVEMQPQDNDHIDDISNSGRIRNSTQLKKVKVWGEQFFEHFLDGSAGVMYTSFVGLIISEFVRYGEGKE
mmetsp:Transcript_9672/g.18156  ORF Transcript_9672/g.18156 Transcript_9672/m.18156 type:complete len:366 (+) Transcript_9672:103-1200(+)